MHLRHRELVLASPAYSGEGMLSRFSTISARWLFRTMSLILLVSPFSRSSWAQDTVEYAGASASSAAKVSSMSKVLKRPDALLPKPGNAPSSTPAKGASSYLTIPSGPPADFVNRQALEKKSGKDAAKMLLRSTPSGARVWVNGAFVGQTPLLLIVPPGKYHVKMADDRLDTKEQDLAVLPHETHEFLLRLVVRYPTSVSIR